MTSQYLLDTNVCIEIARGRHPGIQKRMASLSYGQVTICSIVWAELELGAHLSPKGYARARPQIEVFSLLPQWPFDPVHYTQVSLPPCGGGLGWGVTQFTSHEFKGLRFNLTPLPLPPPQGGREFPILIKIKS